jgi:hypothetical protein
MTNPVTRIRRKIAARLSVRARESFASNRPELHFDMSFTEAARRFPQRNDLYAYMHRYFFDFLPQTLRAHREYFSRDGRGFGEEAFHSMWYLLLREFRPRSLLEIGVFRGQVISLWALIAKIESMPVSIKCISPFSPAADLVSNYPDLNYLEDVLENHRHFDLAAPESHRAFSNDPSAIEFLKQTPLECVYIDGSHDYEIVLSDYRNSMEALKVSGLLVMDDSSLNSEFDPPPFSFAGHPGPSEVARRFADRELTFLGAVGHQNVYMKPSI